MTPRKASVGELLNEYQRLPLKLPEFQRPYSWEKTQVATFWGDIVTFRDRYIKNPVSAEYFLGPVVLMTSESDITVLDGQQRLATATIFLAVLRDTARRLHAEHSSPDLHDFGRDIQRELIEKKDTTPLVYSLTLSDLDEAFFHQKIKASSPGDVKPSTRSNQLLLGAYDYFTDAVTPLVTGKTAAEQVRELKWLKDALTKGMYLVAIYVSDEESAYDIFETLNDRGLRLSVPDLVVNLLLKRCPDSGTRKTVRQTWNAMIQQIGRRDVSRFLRHFWLSKFGDLKAKGLYSEIKDHLSLKKITSVDFAQACSESCDDYLMLLDVDKSLPKDAQRDVEGLVRYLTVLNSLPLLLAGHQCLTDTDFAKLAKLVVSLYIRHTLIGNQNPLELETVFYDSARELRAQTESKVSSAKALQKVKAKLAKLNPNDTLVEQQFEDLTLSKAEAAWFMVQIANAQQSRTKELGMDKANIEHIFPQNAGTDWPDRTQLEPFIWHVGNLTVLGKRINSKAQNKSFSDKCKEHYSKSEITMTKDLLKETKWDEPAIRKRAKNLAKIATDIWK